MSKNNKGMICLLNEWEWDDKRVSKIEPDCRNHRHISRRRLFQRTEDARFADRILAQYRDPELGDVGWIVQVANRAYWADRLPRWISKLRLAPAHWRAISDHVRRCQAIIDSGGKPPFEIVEFPRLAMDELRTHSRDAATNKTQKTH